MHRRQAAWLGALALASCLAPPVVHAEDVAAFYAGRRVSWILSADAGGGNPAYAQAFAPFFADHIPGKPTIVIQNMPGGGGLRAMNQLYAIAPRDGSTIGLVHSSVPFAPLYGIRGARFDPREMGWIGSIATSRGICVAWRTAQIATWQDMLNKEFTVGGTGAGSQMETIPALLNKLFGTRMKVISGYQGGNAIYLAMERGEVQGRCGGLVSSINATRPDWFAEKKESDGADPDRAQSQCAVSRRARDYRARKGRTHPRCPAARARSGRYGSADPRAARRSDRASRRVARRLSRRDE